MHKSDLVSQLQGHDKAEEGKEGGDKERLEVILDALKNARRSMLESGEEEETEEEEEGRPVTVLGRNVAISSEAEWKHVCEEVLFATIA